MKKSIRIFCLAALSFLLTCQSFAQVSINQTGAAPSSNAILDLQSDHMGLLIPRIDAADKATMSSSLTTDDEGLLIYENGVGFQYFDGTSWQSIGSSSGGGSQTLTLSGQDLSISGGNTVTLPIGDFTANGGDFLANGYRTASGLTPTVDYYSSIFLNSGTTPVASTGHKNTGVGSLSLFYNTTGEYNSAFGHGALLYNSTGSNNVSMGVGSLVFNVGGSNNTALGMQSMYNNISGEKNVALGMAALLSNTTASWNTALGSYAMQLNQTGARNTTVGHLALGNNLIGADNVAIGMQALENNLADANTACGAYALLTNQTGTGNTAIGYNADVSANNLSNSTAIGNNAIVDASNKIQLGNSAVTSVATSGQLTTGAVTYPNTDGANGEVLTTDGSGNATWGDVPGLPASPATGAMMYWNGSAWVASSDLLNTGGSGIEIAGPLSSGTASLVLRNGDVNTGALGRTQIRFGYNNTDQYQHYIQTRHNALNSSNAIDFYVSDGTAAGGFPANSVHNLSLVSGNVGIGTNNPSANLDVVGTMQYVDGNQGAGKVLTSDGSGNATWGDVPGLPTSPAAGAMNYWDGSAWIEVAPGTNGQTLSFCDGVPSWVPCYYPSGTVHCNGTATTIVDVINPTTGKIWMDRNLGASQAAISSTDANSYGDLYQWGRAGDGHQCRTSGTTATLSSSDQPGHGNFILTSGSPSDWRSPENSILWQSPYQINDPCPDGYRVPTNSELEAERYSWGSGNSNAAGAFASPLKLPLGGFRYGSDGSLFYVGTRGNYWSAMWFSSNSPYLYIYSAGASINYFGRAYGCAVRCIKD